MTGRPDLADQLVAEADAALLRRKVLLSAAVLLRRTKSTATARRWVTEWDGPPEVKSGVLGLLSTLNGEPS